jgi:hypothetical protein
MNVMYTMHGIMTLHEHYVPEVLGGTAGKAVIYNLHGEKTRLHRVYYTL